MLIKCLVVGPIETNCYIVTDENTLECAVIDPGDESNTIMNYLEENQLTAKYIFLTHGHFDHTTAVVPVQKQTGATVCVHSADVGEGEYCFQPPAGTVFYREGDQFRVGSLLFQVIETPGHTPGGVTLLCEDALFCGDTLFRDSCGRTDLSGGDMPTLMQSLKRLGNLAGNYEVYPGHMEQTTLDRERRYNYYLRYAVASDSSRQ